MKYFVDKNTNLRNFISEKLKISKNKSKNLIDKRIVFVNNKRIWISNYNLKVGDIIQIPDYIDNSSFDLKNSIIYEDDFIIGVNKYYNIITDNNYKSLENLLKNYFSNNEIKAIHRLDKETSGANIFAKNNTIFENFKENWDEIYIKKIYLAKSYNSADFDKIEINSPIDGKPANTKVHLISKNNKYSFFKIELSTGRKHQIRIHLSKLGYPILGDKIYGPNILKSDLEKFTQRQMLHSYEILIKNPFNNNLINIKAPLSEDFSNILLKLGFNPKLCDSK